MNCGRFDGRDYRRLGSIAAFGPLVFLAGWAISAELQDGFHIVRDDESALAATGAAHPWITMTGDSVLGLSILALAILVGATLQGSRRVMGCALLAIAGVCAIVQALVREDCVADLGLCTAAGRSEASTWRQPVHDGASGFAFVAVLAAAFVLAPVLLRYGSVRLARYSTATAAIGLVLLVFFIAVSESAIGGLAEFLFLLVILGWVSVLGWRIAGVETSRSHTAG